MRQSIGIVLLGLGFLSFVIGYGVMKWTFQFGGTLGYLIYIVYAVVSMMIIIKGYLLASEKQEE